MLQLPEFKRYFEYINFARGVFMTDSYKSIKIFKTNNVFARIWYIFYRWCTRVSSPSLGRRERERKSEREREKGEEGEGDATAVNPYPRTLPRRREAAGPAACLGLGAADVARRASVAWRASIRTVHVSRAPLAYAGSSLPSFLSRPATCVYLPCLRAPRRLPSLAVLLTHASFGETEARPNRSRIESRRAGTDARACVPSIRSTGASRSQRLREAGHLRGETEKKRERERGKSRPQLPVPWLSAEYTRLWIPVSDNVRVLFRPSRLSCVHRSTPKQHDILD